jgi:hypothetical protein
VGDVGLRLGAGRTWRDRHRADRVGLAQRDQGLIANGLRSLGSGLGLFVAFGLFFEGVIGLSGTPFLTSDAGPYILVGAGVVILAFGLLRGRRATT